MFRKKSVELQSLNVVEVKFPGITELATQVVKFVKSHFEVLNIDNQHGDFVLSREEYERATIANQLDNKSYEYTHFHLYLPEGTASTKLILVLKTKVALSIDLWPPFLEWAAAMHDHLIENYFSYSSVHIDQNSSFVEVHSTMPLVIYEHDLFHEIFWNHISISRLVASNLYEQEFFRPPAVANLIELAPPNPGH